MKFTPENVISLNKNQVFTFGSNSKNFHGAGAAKAALKFGAVYGKGGQQGQTYALDTKDHNIQTLSLSKIKENIKKYLDFAAEHPDLEFLTTKVATGLCGYSIEEIAELFSCFTIPSNVILPCEFWEYRWNKEKGIAEDFDF